MATNDKSTTKSTPKNTTNAPTSTEAPAPAEATTVAEAPTTEAPATEIVSAAEAKIDLASMDAADILRLSPDVIGAQLGSIPAAVVAEIARTAGPSRMPAIVAKASKEALARAFADDGQTMSRLVPILPHFAHKLVRLPVVMDEDIEEALAAMPPEEQAAYRDVMARMNPEKPGVYVTNNRFQVADLRMYQGTGTDQGRPELCPPGGIYSGDGVIHMALPPHSAMLKVPTFMRAAVIGLFDGQQLWPLKDKDNNIVNRPGFPESTRNAPQCTSLDRVRGSFLGDCNACALKPFANGKPDKDGCQSETQLYLVIKGLKGIYRMTVSSTSMKPGVGPIKQKLRSWPYPWFSWFDFTTDPQSEGQKKWFTLKTTVAVGENGQAVDTTPAERNLLAVLARRIETEVYLPALASIWNRAERSAPTNEPVANTGGLLAAAGAIGALPPGGGAPQAPNYGGSGNI